MFAVVSCGCRVEVAGVDFEIVCPRHGRQTAQTFLRDGESYCSRHGGKFAEADGCIDCLREEGRVRGLLVVCLPELSGYAAHLGKVRASDGGSIQDALRGVPGAAEILGLLEHRAGASRVGSREEAQVNLLNWMAPEKLRDELLGILARHGVKARAWSEGGSHLVIGIMVV